MKAFKLGRMTVTSIFRKPETVCYPLETKEAPRGFRGSVALDVEACVFCGMCARACPANAITVDRKESSWSVDPLSCVQCSSCVEACPKECLSMAQARPAVTGKKGGSVLVIRAAAGE